MKLKFQKTKCERWYPFTLSSKNDFVELDAFSIETNPISEIIRAMEQSYIYGETGEAWLSLEPHHYQLCFIPINEQITVKVFFVKVLPSKTDIGNNERMFELLFESTEERTSVLMGIWRGLKEEVSRIGGYDGALDLIEKNVRQAKS